MSFSLEKSTVAIFQPLDEDGTKSKGSQRNKYRKFKTHVRCHKPTISPAFTQSAATACQHASNLNTEAGTREHRQPGKRRQPLWLKAITLPINGGLFKETLKLIRYTGHM